MRQKSQTKPATTHVRIRRDHRRRVRNIALTQTLKGDDTTSMDVISDILEKELPKRERKLGIK